MVDCGGFGSTVTEEQKLKTSYLLQGMVKMNYAAINLTDKDLQYGEEFLEELQKKYKLAFTSANVYKKDSDKLYAEPYIVQKVDGIKIGIFGVTSSTFNARMNQFGFDVKDPVVAAKSTVQKLREKCDVVVALAYLGLAQSEELAAEVEGIDFVISGSKWDMTKTPVQQGSTVIMKPGSQGKYLGQITFNVIDKKPALVEGKLVPLNDKITDDADLADLVKKYDSEVEKKAAGTN